MFMRFFLYAENDNDAMYVYEDCIKHIVDYIVERDGLKVKPYWKFSDMYVIEESFKVKIDRDKYQSFLKSISDCWVQFGYPEINELLASETGLGKYMKNNLSMVNLFFEDEELHLIPKM